jgi:type II secretory pathway pseudopilin PulG
MTPANPTTRRRNQAGYTLLMVVFMVATMIILAAAATPNLLTQGRREKEEEMVWRGEQYERAIGLYYRKFGKYPTKVEDLTRQTNGVRFLRQAYTDPMNKDDGSWRFIYVGPNGQLIGSLRQTSLLQGALAVPGLNGSPALGGGLQPLAPLGATAGGTTGANQAPGVGQPGQQTNPANAANPLESQPQPFEGAVLGGNIIGVGSKIKKPSIRVYLGGDTYQEWEFIWNPTGLNAIPGQAGVNPNANPTTAPNGTAPNGANPNSPDGQQIPQNPQIPPITVPTPTQ